MLFPPVQIVEACTCISLSGVCVLWSLSCRDPRKIQLRFASLTHIKLEFVSFSGAILDSLVGE